jgi:hypothetical protein
LGAALGQAGQPSGDAGQAAGGPPEESPGALGQTRQGPGHAGDDSRRQARQQTARRLGRERQRGGQDRQAHGVAEAVVNHSVGFEELVLTHVVDVT